MSVGESTETVEFEPTLHFLSYYSISIYFISTQLGKVIYPQKKERVKASKQLTRDRESECYGTQEKESKNSLPPSSNYFLTPF